MSLYVLTPIFLTDHVAAFVCTGILLGKMMTDIGKVHNIRRPIDWWHKGLLSSSLVSDEKSWDTGIVYRAFSVDEYRFHFMELNKKEK